MKTSFLVKALLLGMVTLGGCQFGFAPTTGGGGTEGQGLSGRLVDVNGNPVTQASVRVQRTGKVVQSLAKQAVITEDSTQTNAQGSFSFADLKAGTYTLSATARRGDTTLSLFVRSIVLTKDTVLAADTLRASGSLSFTVFSGGAPFEGALCFVPATSWKSKTDAAGVCTLEGLPPGSFQVSLYHPFLPAAQTAAIQVSSGGHTSAAPLYLNGEGPVDTSDIDTTGDGILSAHLLAYFPFNEGSGTSTSATGKSGVGAATVNAVWTAGVHGTGLRFNNANHSAAVPTAPGLTGMDQLTVEAWVNLSRYEGPYQRIAGVWNLDDVWTLTVFTGGYFGLEVNSPNGEDKASRSNRVVPLNTWTHLAGVYSGDSIILYMNGERVYGRGSIDRRLATSNTAPLEIGAILDDGALSVSYSWPGDIDELKIYDTALTSAQVLSNYRKHAPPVTPPPAADTALLPTQDTHVWGPSPAGSAIANTNDNLGKATHFCIGAYDVSTVHRGLMQFEIPAGRTSAQITKAVLRIYVRNWLSKNVHAGNFRIDAHRLLKSWKEGSGSALDTKNSATVDGATGRERFWGSQNGSEDWSSLFLGLNGTDAVASPAGTVTHPLGYMQAWDIDITDLAKFWADNPSQNFGVVLTTDMPVSNPQVVDLPHFHSREAAVADTLKPRLLLE